MANGEDAAGILGQKKAVRTAAAASRSILPEELRTQWSSQACRSAIDWLSQLSDTIASFMIYVPFRSELDTRELIEWGWQTGLSVIVPRCEPSDRSMELYLLKSWEELAPGAYGILEPDVSQAERCGPDFIPDAIFVPGLAFDLQGGRLGYGGGYYDRYREQLTEQALRVGKPLPPWIGLGFESQLQEEVPMEVLDARIGAMITEQGMRIINR
ncbi:5-formyltetrahydrofolate cyclo-ligase [Paenibacillus sepulcri]|uniref:5-formyltetrahydrofolate cyclo-ligase n=1 Tax=Paenibacillus sepulcri TaxID=359917 RepID=A0ABS7C9X9_9BACL|nr:5-formyltetrahydrofolate cyclo-ligase [Paenibacillus sepulcri]